jgi:hypothetical protein
MGDSQLRSYVTSHLLPVAFSPIQLERKKKKISF